VASWLRLFRETKEKTRGRCAKSYSQPLTLEVIATLGLRRARKPQRGTSVATVLIVKGAFGYFLVSHLLGFPGRPMLQHGIEHGQKLMHARRQGDFFDLPRREEPFVKDFALRVKACRHDSHSAPLG
jgi:hypothetical protein